MGATGAHAGAAVSLQLEDVVGDGGRDIVELLLAVVSGRDPQPADHRVPVALARAYSRQAADRLGRIAWSSQPSHSGVHPPAARAIMGGVFARLCTRTEPGRVSVVALEAVRIAQLLPTELWPVKPLCPQGPAPDAATTHSRACLLVAS
jgi:hypothetical protein